MSAGCERMFTLHLLVAFFNNLSKLGLLCTWSISHSLPLIVLLVKMDSLYFASFCSYYLYQFNTEAVFTLANPDYRGWAKSARFHGLPPVGSGRAFRLDRSSTFSSSIARISRMGALHRLQKSCEYQRRCSFSNLESNMTVVWVLVGGVSYCHFRLCIGL